MRGECKADRAPVNFRPVGLFSGRNSKLKKGLLFRSGQIDTDFARRWVRSIGVRIIFDLRTRTEISERTLDRQDIAFGLRRERFEISGRARRRNRFDCSTEIYANWYLDLVLRNTAVIRDIFIRLADSSCPPGVLCCRAGKDRTGVVVALLLDLLGYTRAEIAQEYEFGQSLLRNRIDDFEDNWSRDELTREQYLGRLETPGLAVQMLLSRVDTLFGNSRSMLGGSGLSTATIQRLQNRLLKAPSDLGLYT
jgi:protein-tyrosine phosphatase